MKGKRTPGKFDKHGELNCGECVHFWEETSYSEASMYGERDEGCHKRQKAIHEGGNCRHWTPQPKETPNAQG